jgi:hypothetical protein
VGEDKAEELLKNMESKKEKINLDNEDQKRLKKEYVQRITN